MSFARFFRRYVLGIRPEELPWARDAWNAVQNGGPLCIAEDDLAEHLGLNPPGEARRLANTEISIVYIKSNVGWQLRETLDMFIMAPKGGGIVVYFTDGRPVSWKRPSALNQYDVPEGENDWYIKVLEEVRKVS
jgi:hypothetical protein